MFHTPAVTAGALMAAAAAAAAAAVGRVEVREVLGVSATLPVVPSAPSPTAPAAPPPAGTAGAQGGTAAGGGGGAAADGVILLQINGTVPARLTEQVGGARSMHARPDLAVHLLHLLMPRATVHKRCSMVRVLFPAVNGMRLGRICCFLAALCDLFGEEKKNRNSCSRALLPVVMLFLLFFFGWH